MKLRLILIVLLFASCGPGQQEPKPETITKTAVAPGYDPEARLQELGISLLEASAPVANYVNAAPEFTQHPQVINGFSDLIVEVFGPAGKHARAAVGMGSLPNNIAVEIEMIVEVEAGN